MAIIMAGIAAKNIGWRGVLSRHGEGAVKGEAEKPKINPRGGGFAYEGFAN